MQDVDDGPRVGRRRLAAVPGERATAPTPRHKGSVVPAPRLLEVASALSDGATKLHAQLRHLDPSERDAVLDAVTDQVTVILGLWADLVRGVVSSEESPAGAGDEGRAPAVHEPTGRLANAFDTARREPVPDAPWRDLDGPDAPLQDPALGAVAPPEVADELRAAQERAVGGHPARLAGAPAAPVPAPLVRRDVGGSSRHDRLTRDELTGVLNRQAGFAALGREIDRCRRSGERFVLGYLNVDGMRALNDTRGTRAGDEVLRKVSAALRATLRSYDVIARLGGDEFLFSLPGADTPTAELRCKEFAVILSEEAPGASASVGFAELGDDDTLDDLVAAAETAMLKGRRTRRRGRG